MQQWSHLNRKIYKGKDTFLFNLIVQNILIKNNTYIIKTTFWDSFLHETSK